VTIITLTNEGRTAFEQHVHRLTDSIKPNGSVEQPPMGQESQAAAMH